MSGTFALAHGGRHVVVSGAATGIGAAVVDRLQVEAVRVTGIGLDADEGRAGQARLRAQGADYTFREVDVTDVGAVEEFGQAFQAGFSGADELAGVVTCAGVYPGDQRLEDITPEQFHRVLDVNLIGTFLLCRSLLPALRRAGGGSVVTISSVHAVAGAPGQGAYAASKAAIAAMTRQIAVDYARDGIRANSVLVGSVNTRITRAAIAAAGSAASLGLSAERTALGRIADAAEVADVVAFLLSEQASFLTGSALLADGGLTSRIL